MKPDPDLRFLTPICGSGPDLRFPSGESTIVGRPGGFAEHVRSHWVWAAPQPAGVDPVSAGPLFGRDGLHSTTISLALEDTVALARTLSATLAAARIAARRDITDRLEPAQDPSSAIPGDVVSYLHISAARNAARRPFQESAGDSGSAIPESSETRAPLEFCAAGAISSVG